MTVSVPSSVTAVMPLTVAQYILGVSPVFMNLGYRVDSSGYWPLDVVAVRYTHRVKGGSGLTIAHSIGNISNIMARKPCIHYPGAVYYVILRASSGQNIYCSSTSVSTAAAK